jgi:diguanylate cyclase (GGDEF)-like protein/PAS domain S-box-containing protein
VLTIIARLTDDHDPRLVAFAAGICALACLTYVNMLGRAGAAQGKARASWVAGAAMVFGIGVWTTHFIAIIGFRSALQPEYALQPTLESLLMAIVGSGAASAIWALMPQAGRSARTVRAVAGLLLGLTIAAMHFIGMTALRRAGLVIHDRTLVAAAIAVGVVLSVAAMATALPRRRLLGTVLLVGAVCGLHFTAMAAVRLVPWLPFEAEGELVPSQSVAILLGGTAVLLLGLSLAGTVVDARLARRAVEEARRLRQFADVTFEGILLCRDGQVIDANRAFARVSGWDAGAVVGRALATLFRPDDLEGLTLLTQGARTDMAEAGLATRDGTIRPVELLCRGIELDGKATLVLAVRDVSERKAAERRIGELMHYDTLTGCSNRVLLRDRLTQAIAMADRNGHGLAVLCCNLDRFKEINDVHGHAAGDAVLVEFTNRLRGRLRESDTLARLGADEFAIVQPVIAGPEDAAALAERILATLALPFDVDGQPRPVTASIGIALYPQDAANGDLLLRSADMALSRSKQVGGGTFRFFAPAMDSELRRRHVLERDLARALPRGELVVHYQPLFETTGRQLAGHEALVRWRHPDRGFVPPSLFVPLAEQCGLIAPIGEFVLRTACAAAAAAPRPTRIAVNLSPVQVRMCDLPRLVCDVLAETGLAPDRLELEITEGVLIEDAEHTLAVLRALKRQGARIVLDDFGTGYSSLSYLRRFPFDKLKIDRSFIQGLGEDADSDAIVRSILALGHSLHLEVTGEGVETEAQLQVLRHYGCDEVQGYLLGRPAPALEMIDAAAVATAA